MEGMEFQAGDDESAGSEMGAAPFSGFSVPPTRGLRMETNPPHEETNHRMLTEKSRIYQCEGRIFVVGNRRIISNNFLEGSTYCAVNGF